MSDTPRREPSISDEQLAKLLAWCDEGAEVASSCGFGADLLTWEALVAALRELQQRRSQERAGTAAETCTDKIDCPCPACERAREWAEHDAQSQPPSPEPPAPQAEPLACEDCGGRYAAFPLDVTLPDEQWLQIHPSGSDGVLCARCIVARAAALPGAVAVRASIAFATDLNESQPSAGAQPAQDVETWVRTLAEQIEDYVTSDESEEAGTWGQAGVQRIIRTALAALPKESR